MLSANRMISPCCGPNSDHALFRSRNQATTLGLKDKAAYLQVLRSHNFSLVRVERVLALFGLYTPVLAKHTKNFTLRDSLSIGVDRMQRNFEPMRRQVETWRASQLSDEAAKLIIYRAFIEGELDVPKHLARVVHRRYFDRQYKEFAPRTMWSLSNAFTSAFKELEAIPQFRATAKLGAFLEAVHSA